MAQGIRWTVNDRYGNHIYLTQERWEHITESINHPEMAEYEEALKQTLRQGCRQQDPVNPQKYRYSKDFTKLAGDNTHVIVIVLFRFRENEHGHPVSNNYVTTAFQKELS
jgi:hypothetical protein